MYFVKVASHTPVLTTPCEGVHPSQGVVRIVILSAGTDSPTGDYGATPVGDVLDYQIGLFSGSAQTRYPIPMPPSAAGPAPEVSLNYDSASVDGTSISRSAQPGSVGLGWTQKSGAIVRLMRTAPSGTGNLCWTTSGADFVFSLNGVSSRLVKISATEFVLSDDTRWKLQFLTSAAAQHPDYDKKYWLVTAPDGTKYRFGGEIEPETNADQNSVFWVPSFINATSTSCNTGSGGLQNRAWQWNLDRVEDPNGNVISYFYEQERNYYKAWIYQSGTYQHKPYIRAGHVQRIEYTKRSGTAVQPQARVLFHTEMRCEDPTTTAGCDSTADYPDTPADLQCGPGGCAKISPTFWTYRRLQAIQTQVYDPETGRWQTAGLYELAHRFPVPPIDANGFTSTQKLWLDRIVPRPGGDWSLSPYPQVETERYDQMSGVTITDTDDLGSGQHVQALQANDWLRFNGVNFGDGAALLLARVWSSAAMSVEVRLDDSAVTPTVRLAVPNLSSTWKTLTATLPAITGVHDVYLYVTGSGVDRLKLNWFRFNRATPPAEAIPAVTFDGVMLANRSNPYATLRYQYMPRIMTMTNELGGVTEFTYGRTHTVTTGLNCGTSSMDDTVARPPLDCFRAYYTSDFAGQGSITFAKYKVLTARSYDLFSGNPAVVLTYTYSAPTFAYYDDPTSSRKYWNDFRGHAVVTATDASGVMTEHRFYRGLNGDRLNYSSSTLTYTAQITLSDGSTRPDYAWLRGKEVETRVLKADGSPLSRAVTVYTWTLTAGTGITGAYFVAAQGVTNTQYGTLDRTTHSAFSYDSYGNTVREVHLGDVSTPADDRTVERSFVYSPTGYIVNRVQWEKLWAGTAPGSAGNEQAYTAYAYDGAAVGSAPARGNQTLVRQYAQVTPTLAYHDSRVGYDSYGRPITVTDANGNTTATAYDPFYGYAQTITNALGHVVSAMRDPRWGVPLSITDPNAHTVTYQYDGYGRREKVWLPTEPVTGVASYEYTYAEDARPAYVRSRQLMQRDNGVYLEAWAYYDGLGRDLQTQRTDTGDHQRVLVSQGYNPAGQLLYTSAPYSTTGVAGSGYVTPTWADLVSYSAFEYDELGNQALGQQRSYTQTLWSVVTVHDAWQQRSDDANGQRTDYAYDAFGKLVAVTEYNTITGTGPVTNTTRYAYDLQGNLTTVTDALTHTTVITYDLLGRKQAMADPDMGAWQYGYDSVGNLTAQRDGRGQWLYMAYDGLNRLIHKRQDSVTGTLLAEWVYDAAGQQGLLSASQAYGAEGTTEVRSVAYDARSRPTRQEWVVPGAGGGTFRMDYSYDEADHPVTLRYPGGNAGEPGEQVTYGYYPQTGQLNTVSSDDGTAYVSATHYNPQGQVVEQQYDVSPSGLTRQSAYDPATLRLSTLRAGTDAPWTDLQHLDFRYDAAGNVTSILDGVNSGQRQCFQYDGLNRLTGAFTGDASCTSYSDTGVGPYSHSYAYDAVGNITNNAGNAYTYGSDQPHAVTAAFGNSYGYDANGNQITRTIGSDVYVLAYDDEGRLVTVQQGETVLGRFTYDASGGRVKGTVDSITTVYIAGVYEWQSGATTTYYGGALRRSGYASDNGIFYLLGDQLSSTSVVVSQAGVAQATNSYYPFGSNRGEAYSALTTKRFTGQYHEAGLAGVEGLSYYGARWYDPQLGRFAQADSIVPRPYDPQSLNRYAYGRNSPLRFTDPTGHTVDDVVQNCQGPCPKRTVQSVVNKYNYEKTIYYPKTVLKPYTTVKKEWIRTSWNGVSPEDQRYLSDYGYTEVIYNDAFVLREKNETTEMGIAFGMAAVGMTKAPSAVAGAASSIEDVGYTLAAWCLTTPICARLTGYALNNTGLDSLVPTQAPRSGSVIPASFEMLAGGNRFWVHPNATKHMVELGAYNSAAQTNMAANMLIQDFNAAVTAATRNGIRYDVLIKEGGWELIFGAPGNTGELPVIYHALFHP